MALTVVTGFILFALMGKNPFLARSTTFFIAAAAQRVYGLARAAVKATPLIMIGAVGLAIGFRANVWNIGAEGQLTLGALAGGGIGAGVSGTRPAVDAAADDAGPASSAAWPGRRSRPA